MSSRPQRGLLIIISDFLDDQGCERALQYLADFGHELSLIQIWKDDDRVPPWAGELELVDAESGQEMRVEFDDAARAEYTRQFDEYSAALKQLALRNAGRYVSVSTSRLLEDVLFDDMIRARGVA
jgi:hypothetical protein